MNCGCYCVHLALLIATLPCATGLKAKWTPAAGDKPMPFSKKYREANGGATWENNKEYGAQAADDGLSMKTLLCAVAVAIGAFYLWKSAAHGGRAVAATASSRSSSSSSSSSVASSSVEQQRKARLARLARYEPSALAALEKLKASGASDEAERAAARARRAASSSKRTGARIHQARTGSIATLPRDGAQPTPSGSEQGERFNGDSTALEKKKKPQSPGGERDDEGAAGAEE